jgi:hypothetical protein
MQIEVAEELVLITYQSVSKMLCVQQLFHMIATEILGRRNEVRGGI